VFLLGCSAPTTAPDRGASSAFLERPGGVLAWDFEVHGLPATDPSAGAIVVADVSHGRVASSLALSLRWLRPGEEPFRSLTVLDDSDASYVLYEADSPEEAAEAVAEGVRAQTREANRILGAIELAPTLTCDVERNEGGFGCEHPQRIRCGALALELDGDVLAWRMGRESGTTKLGWEIAPMVIGDGPPKEIVTCVEEGHFDPLAMRLAARIEHHCKGGGGDACFLADEWRAVAVR
jgi:hypothetical protein